MSYLERFTFGAFVGMLIILAWMLLWPLIAMVAMWVDDMLFPARGIAYELNRGSVVAYYGTKGRGE